MNPRQAILQQASEEVLAEALRRLDPEAAAAPPSEAGASEDAATRRSQLAARLAACPDATTEALLPLLGVEELRAVSGSCGLLRGGDEAALRERILRRAAFEPPPPGGKRRRKASSGSSSRTPTTAGARRPKRRRAGGWTYGGETFVAIDFETADNGRDSACSVALVRAGPEGIERTETRLIRPPRKRFLFTHIHGLRWEDVAEAPPFAEVWPGLEELLEGAEFLVAHNAPFDRGVLEACCERAGLAHPALPFRCTVRLARSRWSLPRNRLPDICDHLGIPLEHHDATSDAQACARIVLASAEDDASDGSW